MSVNPAFREGEGRGGETLPRRVKRRLTTFYQVIKNGIQYY